MNLQIGDIVTSTQYVRGYFGKVGMDVGDRGKVVARYFPKRRKTPKSVDIRVFGRSIVRAVPCEILQKDSE
jgi:hypothetical protein